jgi:hypothetical protein
LGAPGWDVEAADLPLLFIATEAGALSFEAALTSTSRVAACIFVSEGEIRP